MPVTVPTPNDLQQLFSQSVLRATGASQSPDSQEYARLFRGVMNPQWEEPVTGIQRLQVGDAIALIRANLSVNIINNQDGQVQSIQAQINSFASQLATLVPSGAVVAVSFEFPTSLRHAFSEEQECLVKGIVKG